MDKEYIVFVSYAREDLEFVSRLILDISKFMDNYEFWYDQNIPYGQRWDSAVQLALERSGTLLIVLSPYSVNSENVLDELSYALEDKKYIIPVIYQDCAIPFRLRRFQHIDLRDNYFEGVQIISATLAWPVIHAMRKRLNMKD